MLARPLEVLSCDYALLLGSAMSSKCLGQSMRAPLSIMVYCVTKQDLPLWFAATKA